MIKKFLISLQILSLNHLFILGFLTSTILFSKFIFSSDDLIKVLSAGLECVEHDMDYLKKLTEHSYYFYKM